MFASMCIRRLHATSYSYGSALYVTGQKAMETYSFLTPYLDCDARFENVPKLQQNIDARGMNVDVEKLKKSWDFLKSVKETKYQLETRREETANRIKSMFSQKSENNESEIKGLKLLGKKMRESLKVITKEIWDLEDTVILRYLSLPNDLHSDTPLESDVLVHEYGTKPSTIHSLSHIEIGQKLGLLKYLDPTCYYLEKSAAEFEIAMSQFTSNFMHAEHFMLVSNSDFTKSLIIDGCCQNHTDTNSVFILQSNDGTFNEDSCLHLVGGASLASFTALLTKHETLLSENPVKLLSLGRHYTPPLCSNIPSLLHAAQSTSAQLFVAGRNCEVEATKSMESTLSSVFKFYKRLGMHFRVVKCSAKHLQPWESLRFSIQMFSCHLQDYVEVGYVASCGTFISKRLLMKYQDTAGVKDFVNVITGQVYNFTRLLACLLEENEHFELPKYIENLINNIRGAAK